MSSNKISDFMKSKTAVVIIIILFALALMMLSFSFGVFVGYSKARFSYAWGENYHMNFGGPRGGFLMNFGRDLTGRDFIGAHGVFGLIINISDSELVIKGNDNVEKVVAVKSDTDIRRFHDSIGIKDLAPDEYVVVIGEPDSQGKIDAKFIRVMPPPSDSPLPPFQLKTNRN